MTRSAACLAHSAVVLGAGHEANKRRSWWVIWLCGTMMVVEIGGGAMFGSIALVADGLHMSTHAGALLLAALAYSFASRHAADTRFTFGLGKLGDLAGFTSAVALAMTALLIGYKAIGRLFAPVPIDVREAVPIAVLGLAVNVASVWLLGGHDHVHSHGHAHDHDDTAHVVATPSGTLALRVVEDGHAPVFQVAAVDGVLPDAADVAVVTTRADGRMQHFTFADHEGCLRGVEPVDEPHAFAADLRANGESHVVHFEDHADHGHGSLHRDNNMRAAVLHVLADAAVSVLVIVGLALAWAFGWFWMDPLAGLVGAVAIASWSYALVRDTGAVLLDVVPDRGIANQVRAAVESDGDELADFHLWRLGPGHLGAILSVVTPSDRTAAFYRTKLARFRALSHLTVEVQTTARG